MASNFYEACVEAKVEIENNASDLYIPMNEVTVKLIDQYQRQNKTEKLFCESFISQIDGKPWISIAFQYQPYWDAKKELTHATN